MKGRDGGAVSVVLSDTYKQLNIGALEYKMDSLNITNSYSSNDGAGVYFRNIKTVDITNTNIQSNVAINRGGGIYF